MTIQIELESLKNEKDRISIDRREKLEHNLAEKRKEVDHLMGIWQKEKLLHTKYWLIADNNWKI